jgi:hypothetical protein
MRIQDRRILQKTMPQTVGFNAKNQGVWRLHGIATSFIIKRLRLAVGEAGC